MRKILLILAAMLTVMTAWAYSLPEYTFNSRTGKLELLSGVFNKDNKWGDDVDPNSVKSVTATNQVMFVGDCSELFCDFDNCITINLNNVNTSQMTSARKMFYDCQDLTSLNVSSWDTGNVTDMGYLFYYCCNLTTLDVSSWNTSNVTNMNNLFFYCYNLTTLNVSSWNTANVINMDYMFEGCLLLTTLDLSSWNTAKVTSMLSMFESCYYLTTLDLSSWNTAAVTSMERMFLYCESLTTLDLSGCNTGNVTTMEKMFYGCTHLTTVFAGDGWSTANVTVSWDMFYNCTSIEGDMGTTFDRAHTDKTYARIDGGSACPGYFSTNLPPYTYDSTTGTLTLNHGVFNKDNKWGDDVVANAVTSVTATNKVSFTDDCTDLFKGFSNCTSMDLSKVNTSNATSMTGMFENCSNLTSLDLSNWNTGQLNKTNYMFKSCTSLQSLKISNLNTSQVYTMYCMFEDCSSLVELDISGWDTRNSTQTLNMFKGCSKLKTIYAGGGWTVQYVISSSGMFDGCTSLKGGKGTTYNASHTDKEYARIDGGSDSPGYFSDPNVAPAIEVVVGNIKFNMVEVEGNEEYDVSTFYIGECEVTEALWLAVMGGENPSNYCGNLEDNLPVEGISWNDCQEFITKLNGMTHLQFRLPNVDEWVWAAKGGTRSKGYTYSGSNSIDEVAWYKYNCSSKQTVGSKMHNELGIHDMSGNVYEIVQEHTAVFGGGWHAPETSCTVYYSWGPTDETFTDNDTGFRLALTSVLMPGDINGDNKVDVSDVNIIINIMLGKAQAAQYSGNADVNNDTRIDVSDVNAVINIMLGKE